jgi:TIR domain
MDQGDDAEKPDVPTASAAPAAVPEHSVFISYASRDAAIAQSVCSALERAGYPCWMAPRDVLPGTHYADAIVRAINNSELLVLILSKQAVASVHVGKELERASSKGYPILALRIDAEPLTPAFEYFLNESQWIDVDTAGTDAAIVRLVAAVRRHLPPESPSDFAHAPIREMRTNTRRIATAWRRNRLIAGAAVVLSVVAVSLYLSADKYSRIGILPRRSATNRSPSCRSWI